MMTCGDGFVRRGRTAGCGVPLLCLGGSDSPVIRRRAFTPHKITSAHAGERFVCVKKSTQTLGKGRVKCFTNQKSSSRLGRSSVKAFSLRRTHSELLSVRPEIVTVPEFITTGSYIQRSVGSEGSDPLYDVPVPRVAKVTRLRRSTSEVNSTSRDVSCNNTLQSARIGQLRERKSKRECKESSLSHSCVATKDLWYNKLCQVITEERDKEPPSTTIQVTYYDPINNIDFVSICLFIHILFI